MSVYDTLNKYEPLLVAIFKVIRSFEETLGPDDDWVEDDRRILFEWLDKHFGDMHKFVYNIGNADYVMTADASPDKVEELLYDADYRRNLISARKAREHHDGGRQWAHGSWADDDGDHQHHVFIFESPDGGTDVYAHYEDSPLDPDAHLNLDDGEDDIEGMKRAYVGPLDDLFEEESIETHKRDF